MSLGGAVKFVSAELVKQIGLWLSTPIGMISAIALGIFAVVKVTDALTTSAAEAREQLGQIASDYQSNENEIKTLNDELTTTRDRINELKSKGTLSFTEASELTELQRQNAALERKIELLEIANNKAQKTAKKDFNIIVNEQTQVMGAGYMDTIDQMIIMLSTLSGDKLTKYVDSVGDDIQTYINALQDLEDSGVTYDNADEETRKNIDRINKLIDLTMVANGQTENLWSQVYNREKFAEAKTAIEDLETVTAESLANLYRDNDKVKEFIEYLLSLGTIDWKTVLGKDFDSVAGDDKIVSTSEALGWMNKNADNSNKVMGLLANELNKVEDAADEAETSFKSIAKTLSDGLDKLSNKKDILSEVKEELDSFGAISADNISKILEQFSDNDDVQKAVAYYLSGIGTAQQLYDVMAKGYQNDLRLQAQNLATRMQNDSTYYESLKKLNGGYLKFQIGNYTVDLSNEKNLATAKLKIETELISKLSQNWSRYWKATNTSLEATYKEVNRQYRIRENRGTLTEDFKKYYREVVDLYHMTKNSYSVFDDLIFDSFNTTGFNTSLNTSFGDSSSGKTEAEKYFDELKYKLETNQITQEQYLKDLDWGYKHFYNKTADYLEDYAKYSQEVYDGFKDMYKEDLEAQKEAWEETKDAVSEYYDNLREQIEDAHDEEDYEKEQSEKRKEIFDLDMQIAELMRDGSEKAKARIAELEEERLKAEEELLGFETDKAREDELSRLEKEQKAEEKKIQKQIDGIQGQLDQLDKDTVSVRNAIIAYAKEKGVTLNFAYASGTRSSVGGFGHINEKGIEMISAPDGNGNYIPMLPSSYVFSAKATEFLWKLATEYSLPQAMYNSIAKSIRTQSSTPSVNIAQPITITMGDVIIKGNADKQTVADIKKQQENTVRMVLQKIKELQK